MLSWGGKGKKNNQKEEDKIENSSLSNIDLNDNTQGGMMERAQTRKNQEDAANKARVNDFEKEMEKARKI